MTAEKKHRRSREATLEAWNGSRGDERDLFVYGTMLSDKHVQLLLNRSVESEPAMLHNYMRIVPPGAFFFIVRQNGAQVRGKLLRHLTQDELARLDSFEDEGKLYFRRPVVVRGADGLRRRCETYIGNVPSLQRAFAKEIHFEDRYSQYLERKIDQLLAESGVDPDNPADTELNRRALRELLGSEIDSVIESNFDGDYVCNYVMSQTFTEARPPKLSALFTHPSIRPYADNYMNLVCRHIIFNQFADRARNDFHDAVRVAHKYYRHGISILLAFMYCSYLRPKIEKLMAEKQLDRAVEGRTYREYATGCISLADSLYDRAAMASCVDYVESNWYSTPTPLGAELEFSELGSRAVYADPGEDALYDSFYWFSDFDLQRRLWRLGGHIDSHRPIVGGNIRQRGFLEYALGRFSIGSDLSRPLFDCPWGMSMVINEAVEFLGIPPHSLHISMELPRIGGRSVITDTPHKEPDLVCLLLLGGDLRHDENGVLREWRIFNRELDTNASNSLNFLDRKFHYCRSGDDDSRSEVMEYKFPRLHAERTDYTRLIAALKDYQLETCARPITIPRLGKQELHEQIFMRCWAAHPQTLADTEINAFVSKVEHGMYREYNYNSCDKRRKKELENIYTTLVEKNEYVSKG